MMKTSLNPLRLAVIALVAFGFKAGAADPAKTDPGPAKETSTPSDQSTPNVDLGQAQFLDGVLAVVNDKLVTVQDVYAESRFLEKQSKLGYAPSEWEREEIREEFKKKAHAIRVSIANRLVNELLISAEFVRRGYQLPESIVDQRVHKAAENATKGDLETLRDQLVTAGLTMNGFRDRIRRRLHNDILLNQEVFQTIKVSPADIVAHRALNPDQFKPKLSYKLQTFFYVSESEENATVVAERLGNLLAEGKDMTEANTALKSFIASKTMDKDASMSLTEEPWIALGQVDPRFRSHIAKLKKGESSPVIRLKGAVFRFTALDVKEETPMAESEVYLRIRSKLLYFKRKKAQRAFVARLYNRSYIRKFYQE